MTFSMPPRPINPNLVDVFNNIVAVQDSLLGQLPIGDVLTLKRVTKRLEDPLSIVVKTQFQFKDPVKFQNLQVKLEFIITSDFALDFFIRRNTVLGYKLDLIVYEGVAAHLTAFLADNGYPNIQHNRGNSVQVFSSPTGSPGTTRNIYVRETKAELNHFLTEGALTSGMNLITWDKAYSLFPIPTLIKLQSFALKNEIWDDPTIRREMIRHSKEIGLPISSIQLPPGQVLDRMKATVVTEDANGTRTAQLSSSSSRLVSDKHTWTISLNTSGMVIPPKASMTSFLIASAKFRITIDLGQGIPVSMLNIGTSILRSPVLKNYYILGSFSETIRTLAIRYNELTFMAVEALEPAQRPSNWYQHRVTIYDVDYYGVARDWERPADWKYYDHEVIDMLVKRYPDLTPP
ncbi:hypothetical protein P280DRAFT_515480 [Massarina eburnea CBS 473.64]|uniref:Uncharacterized protein n=1 Tax=Massarina eburnea CBS 473.64 TaxID=1395130 RepID=A0A6A6SA54_9PLEO|nr:hypothetical protein P280DRAFT_515480 [Massarina eburnea CBS 473.64]